MLHVDVVAFEKPIVVAASHMSWPSSGAGVVARADAYWSATRIVAVDLVVASRIVAAFAAAAACIPRQSASVCLVFAVYGVAMNLA